VNSYQVFLNGKSFNTFPTVEFITVLFEIADYVLNKSVLEACNRSYCISSTTNAFLPLGNSLVLNLT